MKQVDETKEKSTIKFDEATFNIRIAIDNMYDIQALRIATDNRVCAAFRMSKQMQDEENEETVAHEEVDKKEQEKEDAGILAILTDEYTRITDAYAELAKNSRKALENVIDTTNATLIKNSFDYDMAKQYFLLLDQEKLAVKAVDTCVKEHPMWDRFFKDVKGCGPAISGMCIGYLDIHEARHVSTFWSYCGVGTRVNDKGERVAMSRRALTTRTYIDKSGKEVTCPSLGYNEKLHTKLLGVFGDQIVKRTGTKYRQCYDDYKNRYQNRPDWRKKDGSIDKIRCHRAAIRQAVKAFLRDLWVEWRSYEGYEITSPYEVEYLKMAPHLYNEAQTRKATV